MLTLLFAREQDQELNAFRQRFLALFSLLGAVFMACFIIANYTLLQPKLLPEVVLSNCFGIFCGCTISLLANIWPARLVALSWVSYAYYFYVFVLALIGAPADELRYTWFFMHVGVSFLLIGYGAGWLSCLGAAVVVLWAREAGFASLSPAATMTYVVGLFCISTVLHAFMYQMHRFGQRIRAAERAAKYAADHDPLTGLFNRNAFEAHCRDLWADPSQKGFPVSLLYVDLDRFKAINDYYGHAGGDEALVAVAAAINSCARDTDMVARLGGEEIVVLLVGTNELGAYALAERVRRAIETRGAMVQGREITVTASIGWATAQTWQHRLDVLIRDADQSMYMAKQSGRNCVQPALPDVDVEALFLAAS